MISRLRNWHLNIVWRNCFSIINNAHAWFWCYWDRFYARFSHLESILESICSIWCPEKWIVKQYIKKSFLNLSTPNKKNLFSIRLKWQHSYSEVLIQPKTWLAFVCVLLRFTNWSVVKKFFCCHKWFQPPKINLLLKNFSISMKLLLQKIVVWLIRFWENHFIFVFLYKFTSFKIWFVKKLVFWSIYCHGNKYSVNSFMAPYLFLYEM